MKRRCVPSSEGGGSLASGGGVVMMAFHWSISGASVIGIGRGSVSELAEEEEDRLVSESSVVFNPRVVSFPGAELELDDDDDDGRRSNMAVVLVVAPLSVRCGSGRHRGDELDVHLLWMMEGRREEDEKEDVELAAAVITDDLAADDAKARCCKIGVNASANRFTLLSPASPEEPP